VFIPALDNLESARVVHSFFENGSLYFFEALVFCELLELLMKKEHKWYKFVEWRIAHPKPRTVFSLHSFIETAGLACFAVAIALEFGAANSTSMLEKITDDDLAFSRKQSFAALNKAGDANKEAARTKVQALKLQLTIARLRTPREFNLTAETLSELKPFAGTPYMVGVYGDRESTVLATSVVVVLNISGWAYRPPPNDALNAVALFDGTTAFPAPSSTGVTVNPFSGQSEAAWALKKLSGVMESG
jgi:hypothetical protein